MRVASQGIERGTPEWGGDCETMGDFEAQIQFRFDALTWA